MRSGGDGHQLDEELLRLKHEQVSGTLTIQSEADTWHLHYFLGRLLYADGGKDPIRRWYSYAKYACPTLDQVLETVTCEELDETFPQSQSCPQYQLIGWLAKHGHLNREKAQTLIRHLCTEVLFDIFCGRQLTPVEAEAIFARLEGQLAHIDIQNVGLPTAADYGIDLT
ncbi:MAG: hypothetical protein OHK0012_19260 [Synechococcales cyanobacterium]